MEAAVLPLDISEGATRERRIGTVGATVAILRLLARAGMPLSVTVIARYLDLTPSSCFNITKTMTAEGWLIFDDATKTYTLGPGIVDVMREALDPENAFELIRSRVETIATTWRITAGIWRVQGERLIAGGHVLSTNGMHIRVNVGQRLPLLAGAAGRCVAAFTGLSIDRIAELFRDSRWQCPVPLDQFLAEVEETRRRGWALDVSRFIRGATTLAVPIFDDLDQLRHCLFGTMFSGQHPDDRMPVLAEEMKATAAWAAARLNPTH